MANQNVGVVAVNGRFFLSEAKILTWLDCWVAGAQASFEHKFYDHGMTGRARSTNPNSNPIYKYNTLK